jgi:hypothetical protein
MKLLAVGVIAMCAHAHATPAPVETPVVIAGGGAGIDGHVGSIAAGYGWGETDDATLFPGTVMSRVLLGLRAGDAHDAVSLTYGWYENQILSLGFDIGAEVTRDGAGPTTRFTVGSHGIALQLTGGVTFEPAVHAVGIAQLVVEVDDLVGHI